MGNSPGLEADLGEEGLGEEDLKPGSQVFADGHRPGQLGLSSPC